MRISFLWWEGPRTSLNRWRGTKTHDPYIPLNKHLICQVNMLPLGSMYGIFTYIYHKNQPNVGVYTRHGSYGLWIGGPMVSVVFDFDLSFRLWKWESLFGTHDGCQKSSNKKYFPSWWFQPIWKILVKFGSFPQVGVKKNTIFQTTN